ncbi:MAG: tetratricopeptide repeat protein [Deltaproteobacteria bacterium]|nr:tetratricopeptide repeat protein [Deltaproteobacteria bacterium]MBW2397981.1 tetratricopeptide repeat protein [Deltaproteobacteria bacterium]MBW2665457.1 tetratricopeptide repeat protein [Deltaproteobacteria bacterium]
MHSNHSSHRVGLRCAVALLVLLALPGCATTAADRLEAEHSDAKANSHLELGVDHMENGRYAHGLRELLVAETFQPTNPRVHAALAEAYMRKGKVVEAEAHLIRALEIDPKYHDVRLNLSGLYLMIGRYQDAAVQAQALVDDATFPAVWRAYTNRAIAEMRLGNNAVAREQLDLAVEYNKNYWPALLSLGILEQKEGRPVEAISFFRRTLEQKPTAGARAEANYRMAEIYVSLGKREEAVDRLMAAIVQTPEGKWGRKSEEYLKILR